MKFFYVLLYFYIFLKNIFYSNVIHVNILKSPILNFIPMLKLHHIILLSYNNSNNLYAIDFSPHHQSKINTLFNLLLGKDVDAEIRLRKFSKNELNDHFIDQWNEINSKNPILSQKMSDNIFNSMKQEKKLQNIIQKIKEKWNLKMNLYYHNCIHFGNYVRKEFEK